MQKMTILQFHKLYPDNDTCLETLFRDRFGKPTCPKCGRVNQYHRITTRSRYSCACGKHHIFPKAGTIFQGSDTDLVKWFFAMFLFAQSRNGVSAKELERELGVSYKCAWRIAKTIRGVMQADPTLKLSGDVEVDEKYIGSRTSRKNQRKNKAVVYAAVQRNGPVKTEIIPNNWEQTLLPATQKHVEPGSRLLTDKLHAYRNVTAKGGYFHDTVNHSQKEFVRGDVHTNTVDGFFSQFSRSLSGTYHWVSPKYLHLYVSEFAFRQTYGKSEVHLFDRLLRRAILRPSEGAA